MAYLRIDTTCTHAIVEDDWYGCAIKCKDCQDCKSYESMWDWQERMKIPGEFEKELKKTNCIVVTSRG